MTGGALPGRPGGEGAAGLSAPSRGWRWILEAGQCVGCGICADVCRSDAITMTRAMALPEAVPGACIGCRDCERECPTAAIAVDADS